MKDWCEKVHPGKTEGLRLQCDKRKLADVRYKGESAVVRHVGGMLQEEGGANKDTAQKIAPANLKVGQVAKKRGSFGTRNQQHKMPYALACESYESCRYAHANLLWQIQGFGTVNTSFSCNGW